MIDWLSFAGRVESIQTVLWLICISHFIFGLFVLVFLEDIADSTRKSKNLLESIEQSSDATADNTSNIAAD